jgi:hypothetical protein
MMSTQRDRAARPAPQRTRPKMLALLAAAAVTALVLLVGVVLAVGYALHPARPSAQHRITTTAATAARQGSGAAADHSAAGGGAAREAVAARPMPTVPVDASHPGPVSTTSAGPDILLPRPTRVGAAQVPSGFPHTPEPQQNARLARESLTKIRQCARRSPTFVASTAWSLSASVR